MYPQKTTSKSIIRWCKPVHLIVIDFVDSGACSGRKILTSLVYEGTMSALDWLPFVESS